MYIGSIETELVSAWVVSEEAIIGKQEPSIREEAAIEEAEEGIAYETVDVAEVPVDEEGPKRLKVDGGGKRKKTTTSIAADSGPVIVLRHNIRYVPGLFKIYDEIIVNAIDHATRLKRARSTDSEICAMKKIAITIDRTTGIIEVFNDGDGIPVELHPDHGCHVPELIFGHLLTSANYNDEEEAASAEGGRTIGGQNGIGAKACNIYCKWFEVETVDRVRKKSYKQRFEDNMSRTVPPIIKPARCKPYVMVRFLPDYARFGMAEGLTDDMYALMARRVYDATAVTDAEVAVYMDGHRIEAKSFERYVDLYLGSRGEAGRAYERINDGWEVAVATSDGTGLQQVGAMVVCGWLLYVAVNTCYCCIAGVVCQWCGYPTRRKARGLHCPTHLQTTG